MDLINKSLDNVNNFSKRRQNDKQPSVLMYEINSSGESMYTNMTLRELLNHVNVEATQIDDAAYMRSLLAAQILKEVEDSVFGGNYAASSVCDPPADAHRFQNPAGTFPFFVVSLSLLTIASFTVYRTFTAEKAEQCTTSAPQQCYE